MTPNLRNFTIWVICVLVLLSVFTLFQTPAPRSTSEDIPFSQLLNDVDEGRVRDVVIEGPEIHATYLDGRRFKTYAPNDPTLVQRLYGKRVTISARPQQDSVPWFVSLLVSWLPFIALIAVWIFLSQGARGKGRGAATSAKVLDDPKYWRDRAGEAHADAEQLTDPQSKRQMIEIAHGYEYVAQRAEERLRGSDQSK